MKSPLTGLICFVCVIILAVTAEAADTGQSFRPQWHTGLVWRVQAVYASPGSQNTWSQPVSWEYRIAESENLPSGQSVINVAARCLDEIAVSARFTYRKNDMTLESAEISKSVRGRKKINSLTFEGGVPVVTRQSPIPFDAPVFPVYPGLKLDYKVVSRIDDFLKKQIIIEQAVTVEPGGVFPLPEWTAGKQLFKVECFSREDGERIFVQYWDADLPWPVYGENKNMKYWIELK